MEKTTQLKLKVFEIKRPDKNFFVYSTETKNGEKVIVKFRKDCIITPEKSGIMKVKTSNINLTTEENYKGKEELVLWVKEVEDFEIYKNNYNLEEYFIVKDEELPY